MTQTVFVVDDDESMRNAIADVLKTAGHTVRKYINAAEFIELAMTGPAGCVVLDVRMPNLDGLKFQRWLVEADVVLPIIFVTGYADIPMSVVAMKAGAADFLTKPFREQDLLEAVAQALESERATRADRHELARSHLAYADLTDRERRILSQAAAGRLNKVIAGDLGLSEITVKVARAQLMRKVGANSIAELVRFAERLKLS
ncbi:response regulator [Sphingomonas sp. 2R-10]|uniref:response regulator transcription factor n=1 Tax=Sphingomonas sp. 2R-10 TaxID=3045148 RepID=UPI0019D14DCA|nr:response regulator [Sphingomonas sp. 2R-10]MDJ0278551.1 response regulator [Sphingomonas sp. 2R-10]